MSNLPQFDPPQCLSAPPWSKRLMDRDRPEQTPARPSCGRPMRLVRAVAQTGAQPELSTYECRICGVMLTAAREPTRTVGICIELFRERSRAGNGPRIDR